MSMTGHLWRCVYMPVDDGNPSVSDRQRAGRFTDVRELVATLNYRLDTA